MKTCSKCGEEKPLREFYWDSFRERHSSQCRACKRSHQAAYQKTEQGRAAQRRAKWMWLYGLSEDRYYEILESQDGRCAICKTDRPGGRGEFFHVDHDHACCPGNRSCGVCIRGLLCLGCNSDLGWLETHEAAIDAYRNRSG